MYNAAAPMFRRVVFGWGGDGRAECRAVAVEGTRAVMKFAETYLPGTDFGYEYSPEIFMDTELDFSLEICEAVMDVWQPEPGPRDRAQPALHGRALHAQRLRRPDRVDEPAPDPARAHRAVGAHPQRPGHRDRRRRAGGAGRGAAGRGLPVRQRRALRQRRPGHARAEPLQPGHRPDDRLQRHRRDPPHGRVLQPHRRARAAPVRRRPGLHVVLRIAPGRDQEGLRRAGRGARRRRASRSASCRGRCPTCRSTRRTSAGPTRR